GLGEAAQLAVGPYHVCATRRSGEVACWGHNGQGALGDGTLSDRAEPVLVRGVHDAVEVAVGTDHSCARRRGGEVACWGRAVEHQLGRGPLRARAPVRVAFDEAPSPSPAPPPAPTEPARQGPRGGPCVFSLAEYCGQSPCPTYEERLREVVL